MKLYKEMLRKLAVVGLPLLAVTIIYTLIKVGRDCFGAYYVLESTSAISQIPLLRYYVFTAVFFALYGFSFQFSRAGSDLYHSLPVKRTDLYLSVLLATATWMGATIFLNELEMLLIYLVSGRPFVPVYIPLSILYYFVASMMVFGAAAIGCAVSGTVVTALASAGLVLLLPRYVQYLIARGVVERVPIVGWLDFGAWLDPSTNAATGILTMHLRQVYNGHLITLPHILYSLVPAIVMLAAGLWLFMKRPSEIAQKNGGHRAWTIATAVMLAFAVMLPVTMNSRSPFSTYGFTLAAAALGVFIVYQLIVSTKIKKALLTLPFFLIAVLGVLGVSGLIDTVADNMLSKTPAASEIESITFPGYDVKTGVPNYTTLLTQDIAFDDEETKAYVAQALSNAVDELQTETRTYNGDYEYKRFAGIEPVVIKLAGGGTIKRSIEFDNIDDLNAIRMQNEAYADAVKAFPPLNSIQYLEMEPAFTPEEEHAILEAYIAEATKNDMIASYYNRDRSVGFLPDGGYEDQNDNQSVMGFSIAGYIGGKRYSSGYTIRLNTPETVSLVMRTYNAYAGDSPVAALREAVQWFDGGNAGYDDNLNFNISVFNYTNPNGLVVQDSVNFYMNAYGMESAYPYDVAQLQYLHHFANILARAELTEEPEGVFIRLNWSFHYEGMQDDGIEYSRPLAFLRFEKESDEQEFLYLFREWENTRNTF